MQNAKRRMQDVPTQDGETLNGGLAQLGERLPCKQEVTGSIPVLSTKRSLGYGPIAQLARAHD